MLNSQNHPVFIQEQYATYILKNLPNILLGNTFYKEITEFSEGTNWRVKNVGTASIQKVTEDKALVSTPIDSNEFLLNISEYIGDRFHLTDEAREDLSQVEELMSARAMEGMRALQEAHETDYLATFNNGQTAGNTNTINGTVGRYVADVNADGSHQMGIQDFSYQALRANKLNIPMAGRIAIVDPSVAYTLDNLTNLVNVSNNPHFEGMVTTGFQRENRFIKNIHGWDVWVSNLLPTLTAAETITTTAGTSGGAETAAAGYVTNIFQSIYDDVHKPVMHAMRRVPTVKVWEDYDKRRMEHQTTMRYGFGIQRQETFSIVLTDPSV